MTEMMTDSKSIEKRIKEIEKLILEDDYDLSEDTDKMKTEVEMVYANTVATVHQYLQNNDSELPKKMLVMIYLWDKLESFKHIKRSAMIPFKSGKENLNKMYIHMNLELKPEEKDQKYINHLTDLLGFFESDCLDILLHLK